ncbi:Cyanophycinase [termite gut metagenome]|uniref:Cyanophycinase n=1 Tax=termite gut metagenome TaxID=433724 RepID=A0A5J4STZ3_9ZZZZ
MKQFIILLFVCCGVFAHAQKPIQIERSETRHGPEKGSLVIIGGGTVVAEIWDKIIELAGGQEEARFVVVSNASGDREEDYHSATLDTLSRRLGAAKVTRFHLKNIREANDEKNLEVLKQATGIYFSGGRQWRISDVYLNTLAHQEFLNLLARGGVIAGSSAGASIQGSFLWRGDTKTANILIGDHTQGLGFLRNSAIDQHILVRNRQSDLQDFLKAAPHFIGIGLDESTAVVVIKDELEVIGKSYVAIHNIESNPFFFLKKGQKFDLKEHKLIRPPRSQAPVGRTPNQQNRTPVQP